MNMSLCRIALMSMIVGLSGIGFCLAQVNPPVASEGDSKLENIKVPPRNIKDILQVLEYMLDVARQKFPSLFVASDYAKIPEGLDLAYSLFDVVNYQVSDEEVEVFFRALASKLARGATLVVDGWHYAGVAKDPPEMRERNILFESSTITRRVTPTTSNNYRTTVLDITLEDKARSEVLTNESHIMRAFDAAELEKFATSCGFKDVSFRDGGDWDKDLKSTSWRFVMFAEKA